MSNLPGFLSALVRSGADPGKPRRRVAVRNFSLDRQNHTNWCWAAVTQAVERAVGAADLGQGDIASHHIANGPGGSCGDFDPGDTQEKRCDDDACASPCNAPHSLTRILKERARWTRTNAGPPSDYSTVKAELDEGRPVPCRVAWTDGLGGAHFVCIGACADDAAGGRFVTVWDPSNPDIGFGPADRLEMRWEDFRDRYRLGSRVGRLTHVYEVQ